MLQQTHSQKISVVVPFFNEEKGIQRTIDSLLRQDRPPDEVIFVNNRSSDQSENIVKQSLNKFPCKAILQTESRTGIPFSRNNGIENASGDIIVFADSDCVIPPHYLQTIYETFNRTSADAVTGRYRLVGNNQKKAAQREKTWCRHFCWDEKNKIIKKLVGQCGVLVSGCSAFKKNVLETLNKYDTRIRYMDDVALSYRFYQKGLATCYNPRLSVTHFIDTDEKTIFVKDFHYGSDEARINYFYRAKRIDIRFVDYLDILKLISSAVVRDFSEGLYLARTFLYFRLGFIVTSISLRSIYL